MGDFDVAKLIGYLSAIGLTVLALYGRFRDLKREKDNEDRKSEIGKLQADLDVCCGEIKRLKVEIANLTDELERWMNMYQSLKNTLKSLHSRMKKEPESPQS